MFIFKALRLIFVTLDNAIYELVDLLYQLFMMLAETGIFTTEAIRAFSERIYFFLGLIMVFKVSISLLQYILNPDAVNDGKIGASKLLKNIVFVLVGIILVPYIFDAAFSLQRIILKDNIIGNLILGTNLSGEGKDPESVVKETGNIMAFSTFSAFLHYNDDYITSECSAQPFDITEGPNRLATPSEACVGKTSKNSSDVKEMLYEFYESKAGSLYRQAYEQNNMHKIAGHMKVYNYTFEDSEEDDVFLFDYTILVTSAGGIFLAYILLLFCFDVAVRAVKLGFLQLIAPIPLIAKIDPKKGDEVFGKWVKECTSTYVNLFIRLVAIYFALYIITLIGGTGKPYNVVTKEDINNPFVYVFIIFGVLLFVKDLPKLIETLTGMKINTGGFGLKNKLGQIPFVGGKLAKGLANAEGLVKGAGRKFMQNKAGSLAKKISGNGNKNSAYSQAINRMATSERGKKLGLDKRLSELNAAGSNLLATSQRAFEDRVDAARREGMEREKSAGLFGDSGYKGTTQGQVIRNARYKERETEFENRAKSRKYQEQMARGKGVYDDVTSATDAAAAQNKGKKGYELESAKNAAKAQVLFGDSGVEGLEQDYLEMLNRKYAKDQAKNKAVEIRAMYDRGEIKDYSVVAEAELAAAKSATLYDNTKAGFTTKLNGAGEAVIRKYEAYTAYDDVHKDEKVVKNWADKDYTASSSSSSTGVTHRTFQENFDHSVGIGRNASDNGAPTAENSIMREMAIADQFASANGLSGGVTIINNGAPGAVGGQLGGLNANISEDSMRQMAQVMTEAYGQATAEVMKEAFRDAGKQISQEIGNSVKEAVTEPFNALNQNMRNMTDSLAQVDRTQRAVVETLEENSEIAAEAHNKAKQSMEEQESDKK